MQLALKLHTELNSSAEGRKAAQSAQKKISSTYSKASRKPAEKDKRTEKSQSSRAEKSTEVIPGLRHWQTPEPSTPRRKPRASNLQKPNQDNSSFRDNNHVERAMHSHLNRYSFSKQSSMQKFNVKHPTSSTVGPAEAYVHKTKIFNGEKATKPKLGFRSDDDTVIQEGITSCDSNATASNHPSGSTKKKEHKNPINCKCHDRVDYGEAMICCDFCHTWQHNECMGIPNTEIDGDYLCHECDFKVVCLIHLQNDGPELYASNRSPLKKYVLAWQEKGRTDVFEKLTDSYTTTPI